MQDLSYQQNEISYTTLWSFTKMDSLGTTQSEVISEKISFPLSKFRQSLMNLGFYVTFRFLLVSLTKSVVLYNKSSMQESLNVPTLPIVPDGSV
jgi:hypothetical protein